MHLDVWMQSSECRLRVETVDANRNLQFFVDKHKYTHSFGLHNNSHARRISSLALIEVFYCADRQFL